MEGRQYLITQSNSILVVRVYARVRTPEHAIFKLYLISGSHAYRIHKWSHGQVQLTLSVTLRKAVQYPAADSFLESRAAENNPSSILPSICDFV